MKVYLAGPLFTEAERAFLESCARRFRGAGLDCFLPQEAAAQIDLTAERAFDVDFKALAEANALFAWLDGPAIDDGTACEVGLFLGLMGHGGVRRKGIVGLATDLRLHRRRSGVESAGMNLFVAGAIARAGRVCWSLDDALDQLGAWKKELDAA